MVIKIKEFDVIIDDDDFEIVSKNTWTPMRARQKAGQVYFRRVQVIDGRNVDLYLHRVIMGIPKGLVIDHINRNTLDCRKSNLRAVGQSENCQNQKLKKNNTTGFKGVTFDRKNEKFRAQIMKNRKQIVIGRFNTAEEAHEAYKKKALELYGDLASY
jgi:hypothetical protein